MHDQTTVRATDKAALEDLLVSLGCGTLQAGVFTPRAGMGYYFGGMSSLAGAALAGVYGHIWWNAPTDGEGEARERSDLIGALRQQNATYEGIEPLIYGAGTSGPAIPTGWPWIKRERDARRMRCGVKVGEHWFHSDPESRDLYAQAAGLVALGANPDPVPWKTMSGAFVPMTQTLLTQVLGALAVSDTAHHVVAEQARALIAAGTPIDIHAIQWPAGYEAAP